MATSECSRRRLRGYVTGAERFEKQRRLQVLCHRLAVVNYLCLKAGALPP